ncbi:MAG: hypothetical protein WCL21_12625, partial [Mariniphaga sp.]
MPENKEIKFSYDADKESKFINDAHTNVVILASMQYEAAATFNLASEEDIEHKKNILWKQIFYGFVCTFLILALIVTWNVLVINKYSNEYDHIEKESITFLKKEFKLEQKYANNLEQALKAVDKKIN